MLDRAGFRGRLEITGELERALDGADFVLIQIRVGGQEARLRDETMPLPCGCIGQETTGAGGLAKALRTVPVVLEIAERGARGARRRTRGSSTSRTRSGSSRARCSTHGHRAVGLCNVSITFQRHVAQLLGVEPARIEVDQVGLNHLTWVRAVRVDGEDVLGALLADHGDALAEGAGLPLPAARGARRRAVLLPALLLRRTTACSPSSARACRAPPRWRRSSGELLEMYRDPALNEKPALLEQRGGAFYSEAATGHRRLAGGRAATPSTSSTCATRGTLAGLADDDVVEVPARVGPDGPVALRQAPLAPELLGLTQHVAAYERLAVRAALSGSPLDVAQGAARAPADRPGRDGGRAGRAAARRGAGAMSGRVVLAVDGGNSKTDLALLREDGAAARARPRRATARPTTSGSTATIAMLERLARDALARAGLDGDARAAVGPPAAGRARPAGRGAAAARRGRRAGWAERLSVGNDTFAVLRAGTERGWGVAVVCGAGINCVGVGPDGRHVRFPALGAISGDWGGGYDVGLAALSAAVRSEDGRGPRTALERAVPAALRRCARRRARRGDPPRPHRRSAGSSSCRRSCSTRPRPTRSPPRSSSGSPPRCSRSCTPRCERLELDGAAVEVLLGGGMFRAGDGRLLGAIEAGLGAGGGACAWRLRSRSSARRCWRSTSSARTGPEARARRRGSRDSGQEAVIHG